MKAPKPLICIITQSHLCRNPRVLKEALALAQNGYAVHILSSVYASGLLGQDNLAIQNTGVTLHIIADNSRRNFRGLLNRAINRAAKLSVKLGLTQTPNALGHGYRQYLKKSKQLNAALYICHQELATCVGVALLQQGYKVAFDMEDWYSEDLLPEARRERPIRLLKQTEEVALKKGAYVVTTSNALADALHQRYGGNKPAVIYNVFPSAKFPLAQKDFTAPVKLFWFSQTIGPGRGLEAFIALIAGFKTGVELHLLGSVTPTYRAQLTGQLAAKHRLFFHPLVPEHELLENIAAFDIGLALEDTLPLSRNYTITNKFFQYIQAGLPVIATETAGQCEAFLQFAPGIMPKAQDLANNAVALEKWLNNKAALSLAAQNARKAAARYNWETESVKLLNLVADALR